MKKLILKSILLASFLAVISSQTAFAYQIDTDFRPVNLPFGLEYENRSAENNTILILQILAGGLLYFAAPLAIILIGIAATTMIVGGAETDKVDQAKKNLTWTILGLLIIIMSYSIVRAVITYVVKAGDPGVEQTQPPTTNPDGIETDTQENIQPPDQQPPKEMAA